MPPLYLLGGALLLWVARDLISGDVYLHRRYKRRYEPGGYWFGILLWLVVALSCFTNMMDVGVFI